MTAVLPPITFVLTKQGSPALMVAEAEAATLAEVLQRAPGITDPHWTRLYARVVNHLAYGYDYEMIMDPAAFEAEFRAAWEAEPETVADDAPVTPPRLRDLGMPEFSQIQPPAVVDGELVFYVRSNHYGIPYRVGRRPGAEPTYTPVPMQPE